MNGKKTLLNKFKPGIGMSIFVLFFLPLLLFLGSWQVTRGIEKSNLVAYHDFNKSLPPILLEDLEGLAANDRLYRNMSLKGRYLKETYFLDNRVYRQESGYEVFTPFLANNNQVFLINRGWAHKEEVKQPNKLSALKETNIEGLIAPFNRFGLSLVAVSQDNNWPKIVQELTLERVQYDLIKKYEIQPTVIHLSAGSYGAFEPVWRPSIMNPSRHYGYAVQWFGLALVLLISYIYFGYRKK